jgi:purine operon repressor
MRDMRGQRTERLVRIASRFLFSPSRQLSLTKVATDFDVSKTVVSDDVAIIDAAFRQEGLGRMMVDRGRNGGAAFVPEMSEERRKTFLEELAVILSGKDRLLPGGLIYYSDLIFHPFYALNLGYIMAGSFQGTKVDVVMTSEVKGIPLAMFTAYALGVPLAVCRFRNRASDGPAVAVHYPTAGGDVRTMYMGMRHLERDSRVLIVDDFMRGGSTAAGMLQVAQEFGAKVTGMGVFLVSAEPQKKAVPEYTALLRLSNVEGVARVDVASR